MCSLKAFSSDLNSSRRVPSPDSSACSMEKVREEGEGEEKKEGLSKWKEGGIEGEGKRRNISHTSS